jgi:assimilatory nitrate reductase catalytic subunit
MVDGRPVGWDHAAAEVAGRIRSVIDLHGPDSFAFYLSGQLLTEDYYAANKLAKGFLGTANVDTNSRLCMASTVAGHRRAFGADAVPGTYEDLELADLVVLVGSNLAWCHPVLFQRLRKAREDRGTRVVVIDPRRTDSCDIADLHLALAPGSDVALFNGLLAHCEAAGALDFDFIERHTNGFADALAAARADDPAVTGLAPSDLARFYDLFAASPRVVTIFSQGINQSSAGTDKVNAIINAHLATGRIGKPGMGPFSVTGQPNAMGGREVGGLANQLAAHMGFEPADIDRVRRFWDAPAMATRDGLKAVDLFRAMDKGAIKAVWIIGTNPAVSLPDSDLVRRALAKCPVVIVSDCVADTDTLKFAHIKLPALAWGEKDGTVTNSDRTISRQRPFLGAPGEARADWWMIAEVARALGHYEGFEWRGPAEVFREHARLSGFENGGSRAFDLSRWVRADYDSLQPRRWGGERLFGDGRFFTADGRAAMVALRHSPPREAVSAAWPLVLNTGRYRDHWHTMTRTGLSVRLSGHRPEPLLDIHPEDCPDLADGTMVRVESRKGHCVVRLRRDAGQRRGEVFLPMHWSDRFTAQAIVGRLLPGHTDPISGQPESKHVPVRVTPFATRWSGLLITAAAPPADPAPWWVRHRGDGSHVVELAGSESGEVVDLLGRLDASLGRDRLEVVDLARGIHRYAWMHDNRLMAALFLSPSRPDVVQSWVSGLMGAPLDDPANRVAVLAGKAPKGVAEQGPIICACFSVGLATIERAIRDHSLAAAEDIGLHLKAGTGCGSCLPELRRLVAPRRQAG